MSEQKFSVIQGHGPILVGEELSCRRGGHTLFKGVRLELEAGQWLFVRGRNGSGKTTLLRALCGLTRLAEGVVRYQGQAMDSLDDEKRRDLLFVGHRDAVKEELTPLENLLAWQGLRGQHKDEWACMDALNEAGLAGREEIPVRRLSQGQRRRTALSRLLLQPPRLWVLDEPLVALDTRAVDWLFGIVEAHLRRGGLVVTTSHQAIDGLSSPQILDLDGMPAC